MDLQGIVDRINKRLAAVRLSASAASKNAGLGVDAIRNIRRAVKVPGRGISTNTIVALAPVLNTSPGWLLDAVGPETLDGLEPTASVRPEVASPPYGGVVQAGQFLAADEHFNQDLEAVPPFVQPHPGFPQVRQYAWRSAGDSMNEVGINEGMWVVGADARDFIDKVRDLETGDLVIVERTRYQAAERELTVKEIRFYRNRYELHPRSTNPEHKLITVPHDRTADTDQIEVKVIGVVLTAYRDFMAKGGVRRG